MQKVKIGQIGIGNWGKNLLRTFYNHPDVDLIQVCDLNETILKRVQDGYSDLNVTSDITKFLQNDAIDAVVIATQPDTHFELAKKALMGGKHVFVEKPMVLNVSQGKELVKVSDEKNLVLMVGHILEYHPAFVKLKQLIDSGELGDIYYIYATRVNLGVVRDVENSLWSFAPHDISIILMLMGQQPTRVTCTGQGYLRKDIEDVTFTTLHFPDDRMAHIHVSWLDPHKIRKITVVGSKKMVVIDDMESTEKMRIYDKGAHLNGTYLGYGEAITLRTGDIQIPFIKMQEPLQLECQHFIECIQQNKKPKSDGEDGLAVLKVLDAAQRSLEKNGTPVEIKG
ncbi:Gfo/Idh/MocA family oxidoreductase [candidate division KSB1 bacterium]|nr:Gfo/Idh/MocA family oxidoreductase [candidate division KSB1 bacterium]